MPHNAGLRWLLWLVSWDEKNNCVSVFLCAHFSLCHTSWIQTHSFTLTNYPCCVWFRGRLPTWLCEQTFSYENCHIKIRETRCKKKFGDWEWNSIWFSKTQSRFFQVFLLLKSTPAMFSPSTLHVGGDKLFFTTVKVDINYYKVNNPKKACFKGFVFKDCAKMCDSVLTLNDYH